MVGFWLFSKHSEFIFPFTKEHEDCFSNFFFSTQISEIFWKLKMQSQSLLHSNRRSNSSKTRQTLSRIGNIFEHFKLFLQPGAWVLRVRWLFVFVFSHAIDENKVRMILMRIWHTNQESSIILVKCKGD